jgi:hypothetical protein
MESHCPNTTTGQSLVTFENRQSACNSILLTMTEFVLESQLQFLSIFENKRNDKQPNGPG